MKRVILLTAIAVLALFDSQPTFADGYKKFYKPYPDATPEAVAKRRSGPPPETPALAEYSDSPQAILDAYLKRGYAAVGYSSFNSGWAAKSKGALKQGKRVGADLVVVINPTLTSSVTNSIPLTTPDSQTTYHTGQATAYGPGGTVSAYGSGTSTTYGTKTTYIPYTVNRYEYGAIYFVKVRIRFGAMGRALNDQERQSLQTNSGWVITSVMENSPAYLADILPGDILVSMDADPVSGEERYFKLIEQNAGKTVEVLLNRSGNLITKSITLMP